MYSPSQLLERLLRTSLMTKSGINIFGDCCLSPIQCSVYQLLHWQKFITSLQALPFFRSVIPLEPTQKRWNFNLQIMIIDLRPGTQMGDCNCICAHCAVCTKRCYAPLPSCVGHHLIIRFEIYRVNGPTMGLIRLKVLRTAFTSCIC